MSSVMQSPPTSKKVLDLIQKYVDYLNAGGRAYPGDLSGSDADNAIILDKYLLENPLPVQAKAPNRLSILDVKASNPKDSIGAKKPRSFRGMSWHVVREVSIGMMEGGMKYGFHNYRVAGVRASIYFDATIEHLSSWWEGQDIDPDSRLSHVTKAIASLFVLRDAMIQGKWVDDRPPNFVKLDEFKGELQVVVDAMFEKYKNPVPAYTNVEVQEQLAGKTPTRTGHEGLTAHKSTTDLIQEGLDNGAKAKLAALAKGSTEDAELRKGDYTPGQRQAKAEDPEPPYWAKLPEEASQKEGKLVKWGTPELFEGQPSPGGTD